MTSKVYQAINKVQAALAKCGITKDRKNQQQGYQFRGIDDVYNVLSPLMAEHQLCILPMVLSRECVERTSSKGGALFYTYVEVEFQIVSAEDASIHKVKTFGEAMDSADKSLNKAMSAAYKYMAMMTFAIPTEGDNDADSTTHEVAPKKEQSKPEPKPEPKTESKFVAAYEPVSAFIRAAGCKSPNDAQLLLKFVHKDGDLIKAQKDAAHCAEIMAQVAVATTSYGTPANVFAAAKKVGTA